MSPVYMAVTHYDRLREHHSERDARHMSECYLRRKAPHLDELQAAEVLANALAWRAIAGDRPNTD